MLILKITLLIIGCLLVLMLIIGLFMKRAYYAKREIIINAPVQKVFDYLRLLKNQEKFNKWAAADPDRKWEFKGTDGTVGYIIAWSGNKKAGVGEKEIMNIVGGKRIETEIRFIKPMVAVGHAVMETEALSDNQTKVYFSNGGNLKYPLNIMIPMFEKNFKKDMDESLSTLKNILEN